MPGVSSVRPGSENGTPSAATFRNTTAPSGISEIVKEDLKRRQDGEQTIEVSTGIPLSTISEYTILRTIIDVSTTIIEPVETNVILAGPPITTFVTTRPPHTGIGESTSVVVTSTSLLSLQTSVVQMSTETNSTLPSQTTVGPASDTPSTTEAAPEPDTSLSNETRIGIGVGVSLGALLLIGIAVYVFIIQRRKKKAKGKSEDEGHQWNKAELSGDSAVAEPDQIVHEAGGKERPYEIDSATRAELNGDYRAELEGSGPVR